MKWSLVLKKFFSHHFVFHLDERKMRYFVWERDLLGWLIINGWVCPLNKTTHNYRCVVFWSLRMLFWSFVVFINFTIPPKSIFFHLQKLVDFWTSLLLEEGLNCFLSGLAKPDRSSISLLFTNIFFFYLKTRCMANASFNEYWQFNFFHIFSGWLLRVIIL